MYVLTFGAAACCQREREVPCTVCSANKRYECSVCRGAPAPLTPCTSHHLLAALAARWRRRRYCVTNNRSSSSAGACVLAWSPIRAPQVRRWAACPLCAATGLQACPNCLGDGVFVPQ